MSFFRYFLWLILIIFLPNFNSLSAGDDAGAAGEPSSQFQGPPRFQAATVIRWSDLRDYGRYAAAIEGSGIKLPGSVVEALFNFTQAKKSGNWALQVQHGIILLQNWDKIIGSWDSFDEVFPGLTSNLDEFKLRFIDAQIAGRVNGAGSYIHTGSSSQRWKELNGIKEAQTRGRSYNPSSSDVDITIFPKAGRTGFDVNNQALAIYQGLGIPKAAQEALKINFLSWSDMPRNLFDRNVEGFRDGYSNFHSPYVEILASPEKYNDLIGPDYLKERLLADGSITLINEDGSRTTHRYSDICKPEKAIQFDEKSIWGFWSNNMRQMQNHGYGAEYIGKYTERAIDVMQRAFGSEEAVKVAVGDDLYRQLKQVKEESSRLYQGASGGISGVEAKAVAARLKVFNENMSKRLCIWSIEQFAKHLKDAKLTPGMGRQEILNALLSCAETEKIMNVTVVSLCNLDGKHVQEIIAIFEEQLRTALPQDEYSTRFKRRFAEVVTQETLKSAAYHRGQAAALVSLGEALSSRLDRPRVELILHRIATGQAIYGDGVLTPKQALKQIEEIVDMAKVAQMPDAPDLRALHALSRMDNVEPSTFIKALTYLGLVDTEGTPGLKLPAAASGKGPKFSADPSATKSGLNFLKDSLGRAGRKALSALDKFDKGSDMYSLFQGIMNVTEAAGGTVGITDTTDAQAREKFALGVSQLLIGAQTPAAYWIPQSKTCIAALKWAGATMQQAGKAEVKRIIPGVNSIAHYLASPANIRQRDFDNGLALAMAKDLAILWLPPPLAIAMVVGELSWAGYKEYSCTQERNEFVEILVVNGKWDKSDKLSPQLKGVYMNPPKESEKEAGVFLYPLDNPKGIEFLDWDSFVNVGGLPPNKFPEKILRSIAKDYLHNDEALIFLEEAADNMCKRFNISKPVEEWEMNDLENWISEGKVHRVSLTSGSGRGSVEYGFDENTQKVVGYMQRQLLAETIRDYWVRRQQILKEKVLPEMIRIAANQIAAQELGEDEDIWREIEKQLREIIDLEDKIWPHLDSYVYPYYPKREYQIGQGGPIYDRAKSEIKKAIEVIKRRSGSGRDDVYREEVVIDREKITVVLEIINFYKQVYGPVAATIQMMFDGSKSSGYHDDIFPLWVVLGPAGNSPKNDSGQAVKALNLYLNAIETAQNDLREAEDSAKVSEFKNYMVGLRSSSVDLYLIESYDIYAKDYFERSRLDDFRTEADRSTVYAMVSGFERKTGGKEFPLRDIIPRAREYIDKEYKFMVDYLKGKFEVEIERPKEALKILRLYEFKAQVKKDGSALEFMTEAERQPSLFPEPLMKVKLLNWSLTKNDEPVASGTTVESIWKFRPQQGEEFRLKAEATGIFDLPLGEGVLEPLEVEASKVMVVGELIVEGNSYAQEKIMLSTSLGGGASLDKPGPLDLAITNVPEPEEGSGVSVTGSLELKENGKVYTAEASGIFKNEVITLNNPLIIKVPWQVTVLGQSLTAANNPTDKAKLIAKTQEGNFEGGMGSGKVELLLMSGANLAIHSAADISPIGKIESPSKTVVFNYAQGAQISLEAFTLPFYEEREVVFSGSILAKDKEGNAIPVKGYHLKCLAAERQVDGANTYSFENNTPLKAQSDMDMTAIGYGPQMLLLRMRAPQKIPINSNQITTDLALEPMPIIIDILITVKDLTGKEPAECFLRIPPQQRIFVANGSYSDRYEFSKWGEALTLQALYELDDGRVVRSEAKVHPWSEFVEKPELNEALTLPVYLPNSVEVSGQAKFSKEPKPAIGRIEVRCVQGGSSEVAPETTYTLTVQRALLPSDIIKLFAQANGGADNNWSGRAEAAVTSAQISAPTIILMKSESGLGNIASDSGVSVRPGESPEDEQESEVLVGGIIDSVTVNPVKVYPADIINLVVSYSLYGVPQGSTVPLNIALSADGLPQRKMSVRRGSGSYSETFSYEIPRRAAASYNFNARLWQDKAWSDQGLKTVSVIMPEFRVVETSPAKVRVNRGEAITLSAKAFLSNLKPDQKVLVSGIFSVPGSNDSTREFLAGNGPVDFSATYNMPHNARAGTYNYRFVATSDLGGGATLTGSFIVGRSDEEIARDRQRERQEAERRRQERVGNLMEGVFGQREPQAGGSQPRRPSGGNILRGSATVDRLNLSITIDVENGTFSGTMLGSGRESAMMTRGGIATGGDYTVNIKFGGTYRGNRQRGDLNGWFKGNVGGPSGNRYVSKDVQGQLYKGVIYLTVGEKTTYEGHSAIKSQMSFQIPVK